MLTQQQVLDVVKAGRESECWDGRDYVRLGEFFGDEHLTTLGLVQEGESPETRTIAPWTEEAVKERLVRDLEFAFTKALNKRGISASFMYSTIKMWLWVLEDDLQHFRKYAQYGLPLLKAVAVKYGALNPIGDDVGDEHKYSAAGEYL